MANFRKDKAELPLTEHPKPTPNIDDRKVKGDTEESGNAKTDMAGGGTRYVASAASSVISLISLFGDDG